MIVLQTSKTPSFKPLPVLFGLLMLPLFVFGQESGYPEVYQKADSLRRAGRYQASTRYFKKAIRIFRSRDDQHPKMKAFYKISLNFYHLDEQKKSARWLRKAHTLYRKSPPDPPFLMKIYHHKAVLAEAASDYQRALQWYRKGLQLKKEASGDIPPALVELTAGIGEVYNAQGQYQAAIRQLKKAETLYHRHHIGDKRLLSRLYNSLGWAFQHVGDWKRTLHYYQESLALDQQILPEHHPDLAKSYNNIAIAFYYQSDYQRALTYMKNALRVLVDRYGEHHRTVAAGYNNVGIVYSEMGQLQKAATYLEKALRIKKELLGESHPDIAIGYQNLGAIYADLKQYDRAIDYYEKAKKLHLERFPGGHPELANVYANLGEAYTSKGAYKKALRYYRKDLAINLEKLGADHPFIGDTYTKIGKTYGKTHEYERALDYFQRAIAIFVGGPGSRDSVPGPFAVSRVVYPVQLLETLRLKAGLLHNYAERSNQPELLRKSMRTYIQAVELIGDLQQSYTREGSKFLLRKRTSGIYQKGFLTAYQLLQKTGNADYKEYAFFFAEKSTGQILQEQLKTINARKFAGVPDTLIAREYDLRSQLSSLRQKLSSIAASAGAQDSLRRFSLRDSLFHTRRALTAHLDQLKKNYPKYYELKYRPVVWRISDIQQQMVSSRETMIRYFFGPDALFAFVITPESSHLIKLNPGASLEQGVRAYREKMYELSAADFVRRSNRLYRALLKPLLDSVTGPHITIIPDGVLHYLPFESLVTSRRAAKSPSARFQNLPYLINNYDISYAPSARYLHLNRQEHSSERERSFLALAPIFDGKIRKPNLRLYADTSRAITSLPLSKREVTTLGTLFKQEGNPHTTLYLEAEASELAFKSLPLSRYRYIHLATHALISHKKPDQSAILFAHTSSQEDGVLHASEIYNLRLDARLVTLSACNTGMGSIAKGEGIMSLSRAFQYAGAKKLLVSLWDVDDRASARLMVAFYRAHLNGLSMAAALQQAKRTMIKGVRYAHPKYWAPFVLIGR